MIETSCANDCIDIGEILYYSIFYTKKCNLAKLYKMVISNLALKQVTVVQSVELDRQTFK